MIGMSLDIRNQAIWSIEALRPAVAYLLHKRLAFLVHEHLSFQILCWPLGHLLSQALYPMQIVHFHWLNDEGSPETWMESLQGLQAIPNLSNHLFETVVPQALQTWHMSVQLLQRL